MQKTKKSRVVLSGVSVLVVLSLLAGMTMAWFTDTEKVSGDFAAGVLDISVKPGETGVQDLTFENLRPMQFENFEKELAGNGSGKWTNDATQWNTTGLHESDYNPIPAYFKPVVIKNEGTLPTKVQISLKMVDGNDQEPVLTEDGVTITQGKTENCKNGLQDVLKVFVYLNKNGINSGKWNQVKDINLNTEYDADIAGTADESQDTYMTVMIPAGESVRYMVAGYLPETVGNLYQGKHFHAKLVLNAYQMDVTDVSDPDDAEIDSLDRDDLQKLYDKMEPLEQAGGENFLPDAWEKFEDAFNKAESVLKDEDATEDEILDAFYGLMDNALNLANSVASPTDILDAVIAKAEAVNRDIEAGLYQETGVEAFKQALAEAKALDKYATQKQIQAAALKLNEAMANLRLKSVSNAIMAPSATDNDAVDVEIALFLTQYVVERDHLDTMETLEVFYSFLGE